MTALFVCVSQNKEDASQTRFALEFGEQFCKLEKHSRRKEQRAPAGSADHMRQRTQRALAECQSKLRANNNNNNNKCSNDKYTTVRQAMVRDCQHILEVLSHFE